MADKYVNVRMSEECHALLKEYAAFYEVPMGQVLYDFTRKELHNSALVCKKVESILVDREKPLDKRANKPCWGHGCYCCAKRVACQTGQYDGLIEVSPEYVKFAKDVKSFNGTLFES